MAKKRLINAHTHVFTGNYVPPFLAKTIAPWPLYYLLHTGFLIRQVKRYYSWKSSVQYGKGNTEAQRNARWEKIYSRLRRKRRITTSRHFIRSRWYLNIPYKLIIFWLSIVAALYAVEFLMYVFEIKESTLTYITSLKEWMQEHSLYFDFNTWIKVLWVLVVIVFINWSRRTIAFLLKLIFPVLKNIISPQGMELAQRYWQIGRYSFYETQRGVGQRAKDQLPPESGMVILPMDMEYMGSGTTKVTAAMRKRLFRNGKLDTDWTESDYSDSFKYQMNELWEFVKNDSKTGPKEYYYPFLFLDPRRIAAEGKDFFDYDLVGNKMVLKDCFVKKYMEDRNFSGFKIYPALGYYPFDEHLLPIWRYAAENNIPIMSHCVIGVIYYRGKKQKAWNFHPVFKEFYRNQKENEPEPMLLPELKNVDFQYNFTHPLNYLCLLEEQYLREVVSQASNEDTRALFGYTSMNEKLSFTLENLKICMAHYGGEEEWIRYLESDRETYSQRIIKDPTEAIRFMENSDGDFSWPKLNQLWRDVDWYSIISSMLIRYNNVYADLSYIISKPSIYPLLKETLEKDDNYEQEHLKYLSEKSTNRKATHYTGKNKLRSRILFGTDFYVVRNHGSDKNLYVETRAALDDESFDLIARENPHNYLSRD